jgi:hypothetical protein
MNIKLLLVGSGMLLGVVLTIGSLIGAAFYLNAEEERLGIYPKGMFKV